jgi:hypothetical protein
MSHPSNASRFRQNWRTNYRATFKWKQAQIPLELKYLQEGEGYEAWLPAVDKLHSSTMHHQMQVDLCRTGELTTQLHPNESRHRFRSNLSISQVRRGYTNPKEIVKIGKYICKAE